MWPWDPGTEPLREQAGQHLRPQIVHIAGRHRARQLDTAMHHEGAPTAWRQWAAQHGVPQGQTLAGPRFAQYSALIQAALDGLGIGLVPALPVQKEFAEGPLLSPCGGAIRVDQGHYLCHRPARLDLPAFAAFREWLLAEGAQSGAGTAEGQWPLAPTIHDQGPPCPLPPKCTTRSSTSLMRS